MRTKPKIELDLQKVEELAGLGLTRAEVALSLGVSYSTLNRRMKDSDDFAEAVKKGRAKANIFVGGQLMEKIRNGDTTAIIFYLKTRAGWTETHRTEVSGAGGGALKVDSRLDLSNIPLENLKAAKALLSVHDD